MNKILHLLDEQFVKNYLSRKMLQFYPGFSRIEKVEIIPHKKLIWETTYHVVIEFETTFATKDGGTETLPIFCSAHDHESRLDFYKALKFLWQHGFGEGDLSIPRPLFFSKGFNALFYRGVNGKNLYYYIKKNDRAEIEIIIPKAAFWFAKLHQLKTYGHLIFNEANSRIETVLPGMKHILAKVAQDYPQHTEIFSAIYETINKQEKDFLASTDQRWLIHGDAHPENIICMGRTKIGMIDFSDFCSSDFARDLGSFIQQLGYMSNRKIGDGQYTKKIQKLFLDSYLENAKIKLDKNLQKRIDNYYNWTTMRTATHFLIKDGPEPDRAIPLIREVANRLKINFTI
jgi:thiamine kinase-like enzyme